MLIINIFIFYFYQPDDLIKSPFESVIKVISNILVVFESTTAVSKSNNEKLPLLPNPAAAADEETYVCVTTSVICEEPETVPLGMIVVVSMDITQYPS